MTHSEDNSEARERLLDAAETLFTRKGFAATTLREISVALGLSHASLYYHFPGGKAALFAAVTRRNIARHARGLEAAIQAGGPDLRGSLHAAAAWFLSQEPMDLIRLSQSDMPALPEPIARELMDLLYVTLIVRIGALLRSSVERGHLGANTDHMLIAGSFLSLVEGLHTIPEFALTRPRETLANEVVDILLKGLDYTEGAPE